MVLNWNSSLRNFVVLAMLLGFLAAPASALAGPDVRIASSSFSQPLVPGGDTTLTLTLENLGEFQCAYKTTVQLQLSSPLSIDGLDSKMLDSFCAPSKPTVSFKIRADPNAVSASYTITAITTYESEYRASYSTSNTVYARVGGSPQIVAHITRSNPVNVYPDGDFSVDMAIDNVGAYKADSLTLTLSAEQPLEVRGSSQTQSAATLQPRSSTTKTFYMHAPKNAPAKNYALTVAATFLDENGQWKTQSIPVTLTLSPKALFEAHDGSSGSYVDSRNNEIRFTLTNTGTDAAEKIRAKLLPAFPFSTQGTVQYIDELAPGQSKELVFYTDVDKEGIPGEYSMDLSIAFENKDGDKFTDALPIGIKVAFTPLLNMIFLNYWWVWLIAIAVGAFFYRKRMASKAKPESAKAKKS